MKEEFRPPDHNLVEEFPDATRSVAYEGGVCHLTARDGLFYVIFDNRTLIDFVDDEADLKRLVRVLTFASPEEREEYLSGLRRPGAQSGA